MNDFLVKVANWSERIGTTKAITCKSTVLNMPRSRDTKVKAQGTQGRLPLVLGLFWTLDV